MRLPDFALERYFARWEFAAPHLLCASDVEGWRMAELLALADDEARGLWEGLALGYTEAAGHPLLRAEIARLYRGVEADDVLVFSGAEEAIFACMNVLLGPGDHALTPTPGYASPADVGRAAGAEVEALPLRHEEGWRLDPDALRRRLRPATRLVVLNFPHNPTGALPGADAWDTIVQTTDAHGARLLSDEVYRGLERDPAHRLPAAVEVAERGISLGVMSKSFALAGLRIGWVACRDRALLARLAAFRDYLSICAGAPSEVLAIIALRNAERVLARSREIVAGNLALVEALFARWAGVLDWVPPRAGSTAFPRLAADVPVAEFAEELRTRAGVLVLPGALMGHGGNHFRIGYGRTGMPGALARFEEHLAARFGGR